MRSAERGGGMRVIIDNPECAPAGGIERAVRSALEFAETAPVGALCGFACRDGSTFGAKRNAKSVRVSFNQVERADSAGRAA